MLRSFTSLALAFALVAPTVVAPTPAVAQSAADLNKAKAAFAAGKKAFDAGDFTEAAKNFKKSYDLSKKAALLYNVALAYQKNGDDDIALSYYRKFLKESDPADAQRPDAEQQVKELEAKLGIAPSPSPAPTQPTGTPPAVTPLPTQPPPPEKKPVVIKPAGTYNAEDCKHQLIDIAPPGKALDVTGAVPDDSGFAMTLYFRKKGEANFTSKEMKWRYNELIARIPRMSVLGDSIQYYLECKDTTGNVIQRWGKSTSPNLIELQKGAPERFYPDWTDGAEPAQATPQQTQAQDTEEDPLNKNKQTAQVTEPVVEEPIDGPEMPPGTGLTDPGSKKFKIGLWSTTGVAAVGIGAAVVFYISAGKQASFLEDDIYSCGAPPCRDFDQTARDAESAGKLYNTLTTVSLVVAGVGTVAASYFWYKQLTHKGTGPRRGEISVAPSVQTNGEGFTGAAASITF